MAATGGWHGGCWFAGEQFEEIPMKSLHVGRWGRWMCLMVAVGGCSSSPEPEGEEPGVQGEQAIESIDTIEGEAFSQIWGSSNDLWVVGGPVLPAAPSGDTVPLIQYCGPGRWDASV